jgi:hypothetical protein
MGGIISSVTDAVTGRAAKKAAKERKDVARAAADKTKAAAALKSSEADAQLKKSKKKIRTSSSRRSVLTSPLGVSDNGLSNKLG